MARARLAALVAALLLSVEGVYLYRSMPTDEQTAGLLLVPAAVLALDSWLRTADHRWAALATLFVAPIPPLHNLTGLVTAVAATVLGAIAVVRDPRRGTTARAVAASVVTWAYVLGFHVSLARFTGAVIVQADRLVRVPGLFAAWVVLVVAGTAWYLTTTRRIQRGAVLGVLSVWFGLVAINTLRPVFPSTTATPRTLLLLLLPLAVPALVAGLAAHAAPRSRGAGGPTLALIAGPLAIIGTGLSARLTYDYLALIYRSHLFAHVPLLALAGVGAGLLARFDRDRLVAGFLVVLVVCTLVSAPVAYLGLEVRTYKAITTEAEFAAVEHASERADAWATDDHLSRVAGYFDSGGGRQSVYRWLRANGTAPDCPVLAQHSWTTVGAQMHPQRPARLAPADYRAWRSRNDVTYTVASPDPLSLVVPRTNRTVGC